MDLGHLKDKLEALQPHHHLEILRLLIEEKTPFDENQNGVFVNLTLCPAETVRKLEGFLEYASLQKTCIEEGEIKRDEIEKQFL